MRSESDSELLVPAWKHGILGRHRGLSGSCRVMEWCRDMQDLYGPRNFSASFLGGSCHTEELSLDSMLGYQF